MALAELLESSAYTQHMWYDERLKSFAKKWPHRQSQDLSAEKMAMAGFFYDPDNENNDSVTCPFCLKSLTGWEEGDDPLVEHQKRKDYCFFARLSKNEEDWTVEDFLLLLAQRRASMISSAVSKALQGAKESMENVKKRIDTLIEMKKQKKKPKRKQRKRR